MKNEIALASLPECLFHAQTRGGLYQITVTKLGTYHGVDHYSGAEWRSGCQRGGFGGNLRHTALMVAQKMHDSAFCDGHNFHITRDTIGVGDALKLGTPGQWFPYALVNAAA